MEKTKKYLQAESIPQRLTLYVKPQHRELLRWVQAHAKADSLSEAVFLALAELKTLTKEKQLRAFAHTRGIWEGDEKIAEAFEELESGWEGWRRQVDGS